MQAKAPNSSVTSSNKDVNVQNPQNPTLATKKIREEIIDKETNIATNWLIPNKKFKMQLQI